MSCKSAASRISSGHFLSAECCTVRSKCSHTSNACALFCSTPIPFSSSGRIYFSTPSSWAFSMPFIGSSDIRIRTNSSRIRSFEMWPSNCALFFVASSVSFSIVKPNSAKSLTARTIRRASSLNRSRAIPTVRSILAPKSSCPLYRSTMCPLDK